MSHLFYLLFFSTFIIGLIVIVKFRQEIGIFLNVLDKPSKNKIHSKITPLIGALPVFLITLILLTYGIASNINSNILSIFFITYFFLILGYLDDRYNINAYIKLLISLVFLFLIINNNDNLIIKFLYFETFNINLFLGSFSIFFSILCILLLMNALNLSDGINGLASGLTSFWFFFIYIYANKVSDNQIYLILSILLFINSIFIVKGKFFLGDSGTLFFGSLTGLNFIYIYNEQLQLQNIIFAEKIFILFMIPGIDMFRLFIIRIFKKRDPFSGDLNHLHHILFKNYGTKKTLIIYGLIFISTNVMSYLNIVSSIFIISIYLIIYSIFIIKNKNLSSF